MILSPTREYLSQRPWLLGILVFCAAGLAVTGLAIVLVDVAKF